MSGNEKSGFWMDQWVEFIKRSPILFLIIALGYFAKVNIEKKIDGVNTRITEISKTSLSVKEKLREKELEALIDFRTRVEYWEHHLFSGFASISNANVTLGSINAFYETADKLRLELKISAAKLGVLTQNEQIYILAHDTMIQIAKSYEPLLRKYVNPMIDVQLEIDTVMARVGQLGPDARVDSGEGANLIKSNRELQGKKTELVRQFYADSLETQQSILNLLADLKVTMNEQVYRPLNTDQINERVEENTD